MDKKCSTCKEWKFVADFRKNRSAADGLQNTCKSCHSVYCKSWKKRNPDKVSQGNKANYNRHIDQKRQRTKNWRLKNPAKAAMQCSKRFKAIKERTPKWLTKQDWDKMNDIYNLAKKLSKTTGIKYSVDHVLPLRGKHVSGLHTPNNLKIIPLKENISKNNKVEL